MELVAFRPLRNASFVSLLFTSFAVAQLIQGAFRQAVSVRARGIPVPALFDEAIQLGPVRISVLSMITAAIGAISLVALTSFMRRSRAGVAMRAASQDFTAARLSGVRANRVISLAFLISGILAGIAGVLWIARTTSVNPATGFVPVIQAFIASVIGGPGNLRGAVIGGFFLGTLEVFLQATLPGSLLPYAQGVTLMIVVAILYVRPQGLFGQRVEAI
jgi:branched-chain amino acid transport system permease protein